MSQGIQGREYPSEGGPQLRRNRPRKWLWVLWAAGAVVVVSLGVFRWQVSRDREIFERRIAAIRAAGEPVTVGDFVALYPDPPPEKDFRVLLRSCLPAGSGPLADPEVAPSACFNELRSPTNRGALEPGLLERLRLETVSNAVPVELLLRTDLTSFGFREQWSRGFLAEQDSSGDRIFMRIELARALAVRAAYEAELGHPEQAATASIRGLQVARLPSHVGLLSGVAQLACEAMTLSGFERVLNRVALSAEDLTRLHEALPHRSNLAHDIVRYERAFQIHCWTDVGTMMGALGAAESGGLKRAALGLALFSRSYAGRLAMLDRWDSYAAAVALPVKDQLRRIGELSAEVSRLAESGHSSGFGRWNPFNLDQRLFGLFEPRVSAVFTEHALHLAQLANAQTAVAIERWRLAHPGRLPDSLADLVPDFLDAVPKDPFDDKAVRYRRLDRGYLVYCVGLDFTDDGGKEGQRGEKPGFDTTLTVER